MPIGIQNITSISQENLTKIANLSDYGTFAINVNQDIYGGWLYFILLIVFWIIMYFAMQQVKDMPLKNLMYAGAVCTIIAFFLLAVRAVRDGVTVALINDYQLFVFPLITIFVAVLLRMSEQ